MEPEEILRAKHRQYRAAMAEVRRLERELRVAREDAADWQELAVAQSQLVETSVSAVLAQLALREQRGEYPA